MVSGCLSTEELFTVLLFSMIVCRDVDGVPDWSVEVMLSLTNDATVLAEPNLRPIAFARGSMFQLHYELPRLNSKMRITGRRDLDLIGSPVFKTIGRSCTRVK